LTAAEGRRFALTVGGAFLGLAVVAWWRAHLGNSRVLGGIGASLALAGLLFPTRLGPIERAWMRLAHTISRLTTPLAMAVIYLVVLTPIGVVRRALGGNPLVHRATKGSYWNTRPENRRFSNLKRQF